MIRTYENVIKDALRMIETQTIDKMENFEIFLWPSYQFLLLSTHAL